MTFESALRIAEQRLQRIETYDNRFISRSQYADAFNKGMYTFIRKQISGINSLRLSKEESSFTEDLLHILKKKKELSTENAGIYDEVIIPKDFLHYIRLTPIVSKGNCKKIRIKSSYIEDANIDDRLKSENLRPSFDFEQCFHSIIGNKFNIYHNNDFVINEVELSYYRVPLKLSHLEQDRNTEWEWSEEVSQIIIDEGVKVLAGDLGEQIPYEAATDRINNN